MAEEAKKAPKPATVKEIAVLLTKDFPDQYGPMISVLSQVLENQAKYAASIACQGLSPDQVRELKKELEDRCLVDNG